jgi:hypothetical protein
MEKAFSRTRFVFFVSFAVVFAFVGLSARQAALPDRLTDAEFWTLSQESSEPGGYFRSSDITNFTSNELWFQHVIPDLTARVKPGSVYLGVGPEQNFTYMAALKPRMAIIFDIRRGNLDMQLMYKALFELAKDRADFVSMLFAKPRPEGLSTTSTAAEIFGAIGRVDSNRALYEKTLAAMKDHLTRTHTLPVPERDLAGIETIYQTFFTSGFYLRASPSYAELMTATDMTGKARSYLATEADFTVLKDLQTRNMVVPVVGDFAGPKALRAIGQYLKARNGTVGAFYLSNVEQYLPGDLWTSFCKNVATMPLDAASTFIRSQSGGGGGRGGGFINSLGAMAAETQTCR